jgi:hypothetical protein
MTLCISNAPRCHHGLGTCFVTHISSCGSDSLKTKGSELPPRRVSIRRRVAPAAMKSVSRNEAPLTV